MPVVTAYPVNRREVLKTPYGKYVWHIDDRKVVFILKGRRNPAVERQIKRGSNTTLSAYRTALNMAQDHVSVLQEGGVIRVQAADYAPHKRGFGLTPF